MSKININTPAFAPGAAVRGDTLVLTLPDAVNPVVWQFDLSSVKASALEVNAVGDGFALRLKTPRGEVHDIAAYAVRDQAIHILSLVHQALAANTNAPVVVAKEQRSFRGSNWPLAASAIVIFITLYLLLSSLQLASDSGASVPVVSDAVSMPVGEAVSADDILQGRGP
jgi:hypothetical protein